MKKFKTLVLGLTFMATTVALSPKPADANVSVNPFIKIFNNRVYKVVERLNTFSGNQTAYCQRKYGSEAVAARSLPLPLYWCWIPLEGTNNNNQY